MKLKVFKMMKGYILVVPANSRLLPSIIPVKLIQPQDLWLCGYGAGQKVESYTTGPSQVYHNARASRIMQALRFPEWSGNSPIYNDMIFTGTNLQPLTYTEVCKMRDFLARLN